MVCVAIVTHCHTPQNTATHCNTSGSDYMTFRVLMVCTHIATHCHILQHTDTHCTTLQLHCNTLQHKRVPGHDYLCMKEDGMCRQCNIIKLQHAATHCNTLQHM